jgi:hypothetical protein
VCFFALGGFCGCWLLDGVEGLVISGAGEGRILDIGAAVGQLVVQAL